MTEKKAKKILYKLNGIKFQISYLGKNDDPYYDVYTLFKNNWNKEFNIKEKILFYLTHSILSFKVNAIEIKEAIKNLEFSAKFICNNLIKDPIKAKDGDIVTTKIKFVMNSEIAHFQIKKDIFNDKIKDRVLNKKELYKFIDKKIKNKTNPIYTFDDLFEKIKGEFFSSLFEDESYIKQDFLLRR